MICLIVDDHPVILASLNGLIKKHFPEWDTLAASDLQEAIDLLDSDRGQMIHLALVDLSLGSQSGLALVSHIERFDMRQAVPSIVMSGDDTPETIYRCRESGASGFVSKYANPHLFVEALREVAAGKSFFPSELDRQPIAPAIGRKSRICLSPRQQTIVDLVLAGCSNKEIANRLNISYGTTKNYMFDLMRIFSVRSRLELANKILMDQGGPLRTSRDRRPHAN
jgi:two-component system nitrate/nitrite response regulator NarL